MLECLIRFNGRVRNNRILLLLCFFLVIINKTLLLLLPRCVQQTFSLAYLGGHTRIESILILCSAHLLPPHHFLKTNIIIILEVAYTLPINMGLNLQTGKKKKISMLQNLPNKQQQCYQSRHPNKRPKVLQRVKKKGVRC